MSERRSTGDLIDMMGARFEMVARIGAHKSDTVLFRTHMAPGKLVPLHSHIDPECFYVLEGEIEVFVVDGAPKWRTIDAGRSILLANGVKHAVRNQTGQSADIILATNSRFASFLAEAGRRVLPDTDFSAPSPEDIQRVMRVSQAYGYWNASPAESAAITG
jgi:quercetin dioxygenase-like cupin family protein